jgi:hypothetical protein
MKNLSSPIFFYVSRARLSLFLIVLTVVAASCIGMIMQPFVVFGPKIIFFSWVISFLSVPLILIFTLDLIYRKPSLKIYSTGIMISRVFSTDLIPWYDFKGTNYTTTSQGIEVLYVLVRNPRKYFVKMNWLKQKLTQSNKSIHNKFLIVTIPLLLFSVKAIEIQSEIESCFKSSKTQS